HPLSLNVTAGALDWVERVPLLILAAMFLQAVVPIAGRPWYDLLAGTQVFSRTAQAPTSCGFEPIFPPPPQ
ncbi:MAG: hypothetical protein JWN40_4342, partial [Phycisphaerales bacterium]|nr:hypothetical protein [Phycisphaerales bacterium]